MGSCCGRKQLTGDVTVSINEVDEKTARNNLVRTTRYTWWNFLPLFIVYQYCKFSNIFYLVCGLLSFVPNVAIVSAATQFTPIGIVLGIAFIRELLETIGCARADKQMNSGNYRVVRNGKLINVVSSQILQGDIVLVLNHQEIPVDGVIIYSTNENHTTFVSTSSLDGETTLKSKNQLLQFVLNDPSEDITVKMIQNLEMKVVAQAPNPQMHTFNGKVNYKLNYIVNEDNIFKSDDQITIEDNWVEKQFQVDSVLLKGSKLMNTQLCLLASIYTSYDSRIMQSQAKTKIKSSKLDKRLNVLIILMFIIVLIASFILTPVSGSVVLKFRNVFPTLKYEASEDMIYLSRFIQCVVLSNYLLSITLFWAIEIIRYIQVLVIDCDKYLRRSDVQKWIEKNPGKKLSSSPFADQSKYQLSIATKNALAVENVAEIDILFSDKTGTLTKNNMNFVCLVDKFGAVCDGKKQAVDELSLFCLGLCHECLPRMAHNDYQKVELFTPTIDQLVYEGESPDEVAFATAAGTFGLLLRKRNAGLVYFDYQEKRICLRVQAIIPFTSARKRMSIIYKEIPLKENDEQFLIPASLCEVGQPFILTKGADNVMLPLLKQDQSYSIHTVQGDIDNYSQKGYRTLVFSFKQLNSTFLTDWISKWQTIQQLDELDEQFIHHYQEIESNLEYSFISVVEDELQDDLQDTLKSFYQAGIKVWMLTGDKTLTAVNIAKAAGLSQDGCQYIMLTNEQFYNANNIEEKLKQLLEEAMQLLKLSLPQNKKHLFDQLLFQNKKNGDASKLFMYTSNAINPPKVLELQIPITVVIDTTVFNYIKQYHQEAIFFHVAYCSQSVVCCRLTPKEKANIIELCHKYQPKLTTAAVGDGFNDLPMIKTAQVGIGIAGKEGLHASNNSDISIPQFSNLKRLMFVKGRFMHLRNAEIIHFIIYKNVIFMTVIYIYQFYNLGTVQICQEEFILMLYNMFITTFPILAYALEEIDVPDDILMKHPSLYKQCYRKFWPNYSSLAFEIFIGIYQGFILYYLLYWPTINSVVLDNQHQADLASFSALQIIVCIFIVSMRCYLNQFMFNAVTILGLFVCAFVTLVAMVVGYFQTSYGYGLLGMWNHLYGGLSYFLIIIACVVLCLMPEFVVKQAQRLWWPRQEDLYLASRKQMKYYDMS